MNDDPFDDLDGGYVSLTAKPSTDGTDDPAMEHLPPWRRQSWERVKEVRHQTQFGSEYQLTVGRCAAIASSTGQRCRRPAVKGQDRCTSHGGKRTPEQNARLEATSPAYRARKARQAALTRLDKLCRHQLHKDPGQALQLAQLTVAQQSSFQRMFDAIWPLIGYQSVSTRRALTWLAVQFARGDISEQQVVAECRGFDKRYDEYVENLPPPAPGQLDTPLEVSWREAQARDQQRRALWNGTLSGSETVPRPRLHKSPREDGW